MSLEILKQDFSAGKMLYSQHMVWALDFVILKNRLSPRLTKSENWDVRGRFQMLYSTCNILYALSVTKLKHKSITQLQVFMSRQGFSFTRANSRGNKENTTFFFFSCLWFRNHIYQLKFERSSHNTILLLPAILTLDIVIRIL